MKILPKMAKGGYMLFMATYTPLIPTEQAAASRNLGGTRSESKDESKASSLDKGQLTLREFFNMINGLDGLPNEMLGVMRNLQNMFELASLTGRSSGDIVSQLIQTKVNLLILKRNSQDFDAAVKQAKTNGAMGEIAISEDGLVYVQDKNGMPKKITAAEYATNRQNYTPLTNSKLAYIRSHVPLYINDLDTISDIANAMGFEGFQKLLKLGITKLGTAETSYGGTFARAGLGSAYAGLQAIGELSKEQIQSLGNSLDGLYHYEYLNKSQLLAVLNLRNYLLATLPTNAIAWALVKTGIGDPTKAALALIDSYLLAQADGSTSMKVNYQSSFEKLEGGSGKNGSKSGSTDGIEKAKLTVASRWLRGSGLHRAIRVNNGTKTTFYVDTLTSDLTDAQGKPLGANKTLQAATEGLFGPILELSKASIAGAPLNTAIINQIILNDGKVTRLDFPIDPTKNGDIPLLDLQVIRNRENAHNALKRAGIDKNNQESIKNNFAKVAQIYKENNLPNEFNADGTLSAKWRMFAVMDASFNKNALSDNYQAALLEEIQPGNVWNSTAKLIADASGQTSGHGVLGFGGDTLYRGTVWIPVDNDQIKAQTTSDMTVNLVTELDGLQRGLENIQALNTDIPRNEGF